MYPSGLDRFGNRCNTVGASDDLADAVRIGFVDIPPPLPPPSHTPTSPFRWSGRKVENAQILWQNSTLSSSYSSQIGVVLVYLQSEEEVLSCQCDIEKGHCTHFH